MRNGTLRGKARAAGMVFEPYPQADMVRDLEAFGVTTRRTLFGRRYLVKPQALFVALERGALHGALRAKVYLEAEAQKHGRQVVTPTDLYNLLASLESRAAVHDALARAAVAADQRQPFGVIVENYLARVVAWIRKPFVSSWGNE